MAEIVDISKLSYKDLIKLEKQIANQKIQMYADKDIAYKSAVIPRKLSDICEKRFSLEAYPESKVWHCDDGDRTELSYNMYSRLEKNILNLCDAVTGNYEIKNDKIFFKGSVITEHLKEYAAFAKELVDLIEKYDISKGDTDGH